MIGVVSGEGAGAKVARFDFLAATPSRYDAPVALGIWAANWEAGCAALGIPGALCVLASPASPGVDLCWVPTVQAGWVRRSRSQRAKRLSSGSHRPLKMQ